MNDLEGQGLQEGSKSHQRNGSSFTHISVGKRGSAGEKPRLGLKRNEDRDKDEESGDDDVFLIQGITVTKTMAFEVKSVGTQLCWMRRVMWVRGRKGVRKGSFDIASFLKNCNAKSRFV